MQLKCIFHFRFEGEREGNIKRVVGRVNILSNCRPSKHMNFARYHISIMTMNIICLWYHHIQIEKIMN